MVSGAPGAPSRAGTMLYRFGVPFLDAVMGVATRRTHADLHHVPRTGAAVVVCNHLSMTDPVLLACALRRRGRDASFLSMKEAFAWPVVGQLLATTGQIPVDRALDPVAALEPARDALARGRLVVIYPEGKITTEPDYRPLSDARSGAVRLALDADCPVIPLAQWGAQRLLDREHRSSLTRRARVLGWFRSGRVPRRPTVTITAGTPISADELRAAAEGGDNVKAATQLVMRRVTALLATIAGDDLPDLAA